MFWGFFFQFQEGPGGLRSQVMNKIAVSERTSRRRCNRWRRRKDVSETAAGDWKKKSNMFELFNTPHIPGHICMISLRCLRNQWRPFASSRRLIAV